MTAFLELESATRRNLRHRRTRRTKPDDSLQKDTRSTTSHCPTTNRDRSGFDEPDLGASDCSLKLNPNDRARYLKGPVEALEKGAFRNLPAYLNPSGKSKRVWAFTAWKRQQNGNGFNARGYSTVWQTAQKGFALSTPLYTDDIF